MSEENKYSGILGDPFMNAYPHFPSNGLLGFVSRPEAKNLYYLRKKVILDGYTFIGCRFDGCNLEVSSANFD
jgi:hypothetical protein